MSHTNAGAGMQAPLPRSRIVKISFEVALPVAATRDEVDEWVQYSLGSGSCSEPLANYELEPIDPPMLEDTGLHLDRVAFGHQKTERGFSCSVRTRRTIGPIPDDQPLDPHDALFAKLRGE